MQQDSEDRVQSEVDVDDLVARVVEEYFDRLKRGEQPQLEKFVEKYPEISDLLKTVIPGLQAAEQPAGVSSESKASGKQHKQLGDFRILRQIGRGGMGIVYEAEQISMNRRVALKVLPLAGLVDELKIRRFQNEVRAVAALDHPNVVPVYMVGEERGVHYYAMRLIRGRSLSEVISSLVKIRDEGQTLDVGSMSRIMRSDRRDEPSLDQEADAATDGSAPVEPPAYSDSPAAGESVDRSGSSTIPHSSRREYFRCVVALGIQAAAALQHAHDQGVIHRDIKPANLMLDCASKLYVTDFGLARIEADAGVTMTGDLVGTLRYMAPEQALAKRVVVDHRADIYSLAATLYELLTLRPVYLTDDRQQLLKKIAFEEPTPLRRIDPEISAELETIIHKAMSKDMDRRYASAQELADDLRSHLENRPIKAKPPTTSEIIGKWTRRNPAVTWATLVAMSLISIVLATSTFLVTNQRNIALSERDAANTARNIASRAQAKEAQRTVELKRRLYLSHIAKADNALLENKFRRAQTALDACDPNLRAWEWYFLNDRVRTSFPLTIRGGPFCLSRDGKRLVYKSPKSIGGTSRMVLRDQDTGKVLASFEHDENLAGVALSPDEELLACGDRVGGIRVWEINSRKSLWRWNTGGTYPIYDPVFSPDGSLIAFVQSAQNKIVVIEARTGKQKFSLPFEITPKLVSFSPSGRWIVCGISGEIDNQVHPAVLINATTGKVVADFPIEGGNQCPMFGRNDRQIAIGSTDGMVTLWNWDDSQLNKVRSWHAADRPLIRLAFNADGSRLASSAVHSSTVKVWDVETAELLSKLVTGGDVYSLAFRPSKDDRSEQNEQIVLGSVTDGLRFWRWRAHDNSITVKPLVGAVEAKFSPDGRHILAATPAYFAGGNGHYNRNHYYPPESAAILSAESASTICVIEDVIYAASWTGDGNEIVASIEFGDAIRTYDVETGGRTSRTFPVSTGYLTISQVSEDGRHLVALSADKIVRTFDFESAEKTLERPTNQSFDLAADFSPTASLIGFGSGEASIWNPQSGIRVSSHSQPGYWPKGFSFSRDEKRVYIGSSGGLLTEVDVASGEETRRFVGHSAYVLAIAISPDEKQIVSGGTLGQVIVWDVASQEPLVTLTASKQGITSVDWSSDGRRIVAGKKDGTVQIWTLPQSR